MRKRKFIRGGTNALLSADKAMFSSLSIEEVFFVFVFFLFFLFYR